MRTYYSTQAYRSTKLLIDTKSNHNSQIKPSCIISQNSHRTIQFACRRPELLSHIEPHPPHPTTSQTEVSSPAQKVKPRNSSSNMYCQHCRLSPNSGGRQRSATTNNGLFSPLPQSAFEWASARAKRVAGCGLITSVPAPAPRDLRVIMSAPVAGIGIGRRFCMAGRVQ